MQVEDGVNAALLRAAAEVDYFLFCYVARESVACEHPLLPELLRRAKLGR